MCWPALQCIQNLALQVQFLDAHNGLHENDAILLEILTAVLKPQNCINENPITGAQST